jgi:hypothetical protein
VPRKDGIGAGCSVLGMGDSLVGVRAKAVSIVLAAAFVALRKWRCHSVQQTTVVRHSLAVVNAMSTKVVPRWSCAAARSRRRPGRRNRARRRTGRDPPFGTCSA